MRRTPSPSLRPAIAVRLGWATVLALGTARPGGARPVVAWVARVLAARHLAEAAALARNTSARPPAWTVWVDALHAASMVAVAAVSRPLRRPALVSAAGATAISATSEFKRR
jgi:hypothetical protein